MGGGDTASTAAHLGSPTCNSSQKGENGMRKRMTLAALLLLSPGAAWAQTGPENVLPAKSQVYFRWDGAKAHREEFNRTAFGKTLQGDTGKFLSELWTYATENIEQALNQNQPDAAGIFKDVTKALTEVAQGGLVLGVDLERVNPPKGTVVLVLPGTASESGTLLPLIQKAAQVANAEVKDVKVGRRFIHRVDIDAPVPLHLGWWNEGQDAVVMFGTEEPGEYARAVDAKKTGLAKNPMFQKVQGFKEFTTGSRGFIDVKSIVGVVEDLSPEAAKLVDALGVKGLKNITFVSGYDGVAFRDVTEVDMPGPRTGLLALTSTRRFNIKDLPPLPSDLTRFSASSFEVGKVYDVLLQLVESGVRIFAPDQADNVRGAIQGIEGLVGVKFNEDIFGCFGDMAVNYSTPSEGPLSSTTLIKVKDGKKLIRSLETLVKNIPQAPFEVTISKKAYRDVEILDLHLRIEQFNNRLGSMAVYKDWFIFSQYPQGIKGFVLRSGGELPTWKADAELTKVLAQFPKEYVGIEVADSRATVQFLLSITPFVIDIANQLSRFVPNLRQFELDMVPHAQEATRNLFPRVSVTTDDGKKLRSESRSSFGLP
jgi:hypothetical protein